MRALLVSAVVAAGCGGTPSAESIDGEVVARGVEEGQEQRPQWGSWGGVPWVSGDEGLSARLRQAELDRDSEADAIAQAWAKDDAGWKARAAWTVGRIGGAGAVARLEGWIGDGQVALGGAGLAAAAFLSSPGADEARGEAWEQLEDGLWTRYAVTEEIDEAEGLLLAVARVGGARSQAWLAADLEVEGEQVRRVRAIEAMAMLCARGHGLTGRGLEVLAGALEASGPEPRRAAAHTLARCAAVSAEKLAGAERSALVERLAPLAAGSDVAAARGAWRALEGLGELPTVVPGWVLGDEAADWMAEVAAVRAVAAHADGRKVLARRLPEVKLASFTGARLHVLRELLQGLRPFAAHDEAVTRALGGLRSALAEALSATQDARRRKALQLIGCELEVLLATRSGTLDALTRCAEGSTTIAAEHGEVLAVEALVHMGSALAREQRVAALVERAGDARARVAAPALSALASVDDPAVNPALRLALAHADMGVVAAAAAAVAARAADRSRRDPGSVTFLLSVIERFDNDHAVETRIAALDALGRLARSESSADGAKAEPPVWIDRVVALGGDSAVAVREAARRALLGYSGPLAAFEAAMPTQSAGRFAPAVHEAVDRLGGRVEGLRLHTDAGVITIDFSGAPAPIAQANLGALAEAGFFDDTMFHRVVPGFVIQGGDPRGDGYGGPGHVMPCEWSNLRYERGTVGIALAGKDTGGSQLFIAHDRPQHLDARYTVIGRVVDGLDVVDEIWPYDRIVRVERLDSRPTAEPAP